MVTMWLTLQHTQRMYSIYIWSPTEHTFFFGCCSVRFICFSKILNKKNAHTWNVPHEQMKWFQLNIDTIKIVIVVLSERNERVRTEVRICFVRRKGSSSAIVFSLWTRWSISMGFFGLRVVDIHHIYLWVRVCLIYRRNIMYLLFKLVDMAG